MPLRRSVVEHVIRLHWSTTVDSCIFVEAVVNHRKNSLGKIMRAGLARRFLKVLRMSSRLSTPRLTPISEKISSKDMTSWIAPVN